MAKPLIGKRKMYALLLKLERWRYERYGYRAHVAELQAFERETGEHAGLAFLTETVNPKWSDMEERRSPPLFGEDGEAAWNQLTVTPVEPAKHHLAFTHMQSGNVIEVETSLSAKELLIRLAAIDLDNVAEQLNKAETKSTATG